MIGSSHIEVLVHWMALCKVFRPHRHCKRYLDKPLHDQRTSPLSGHAIQNSWDKPSLGALSFPGKGDSWV